MRLAAAALATLFAAPVAPSASGDRVLVLAAASLSDALRPAADAYERSSGVRVEIGFGASSDLARQILAGAPADVFFSADRAQMDVLEQAGLVRAADRLEPLSNTLVVVLPAASQLRVRAPADLAALRRIALADPAAVPAGVYARRYLDGLGLWPRLRGHVVPTLDVRAALAAVESENAEAAIVYRTDAALSRRVRVAFEVPRDQGPAIVYSIAPLAASRKEAARGLVRFLVSPEALAIFERFGFVVRGGSAGLGREHFPPPYAGEDRRGGR